jgi:hypothetical protein
MTSIRLVLLIAPLIAIGCTAEPGVPTAQTIVDRAIEVHGGPAFENSEITFDFRGAHFRVWRKNGMFEYTRTYTDTSGQIIEVMSNEGFRRTANGEPYEMDEREFLKLTEDVNSVVYFAMLPYKLNDSSVNRILQGTQTIDGRLYHEVEITFDQEGGGRDWDDQFVFWFNDETGTLDYLAYYYTQRGTARFRKAKNIRTIAGIRFADYLNFTADTLGSEVEHAPELYNEGVLKLLSEILTENIEVKPAE